MKANFTFKDSIFADEEFKITVYADTKPELYRVSDALGDMFVVTNCYIIDEEKKEN